jgi:membrane associated rhomboid family serine protease
MLEVLTPWESGPQAPAAHSEGGVRSSPPVTEIPPVESVLLPASCSTQPVSHSCRPICTITIGVAQITFFVTLFMLDALSVASWTKSVSFFALSSDGIVRHIRLAECVTAPLLHTNIVALVFDVLALSSLGPSVERALGTYRHIVLYSISTVVPLAVFLLLSWRSDDHLSGPSGMIFGLLAASAILFPTRTMSFFGVFPVKMRYAVLVIAALTFFFAFSNGTRASLLSPLFGALAAWCYLKSLDVAPVNH